MNKLFFDIETLPADEEKRQTLELIFKHQLEKKSKKRDALEEVEIDSKDSDKFEDYFRHTALDGAFGRVLCIGYAINNESTQIIYNADILERKTLEEFWQVANKCDLFIGHNIMDFDLKFLYQRSIVAGVKPTKDLSFARYRNNPIFDTMKEWSKWDSNKKNLGLEHIALALGIPTPKDGIDGSQVYDFHKQGKDKEICDYCMRDVEATRLVYKKMIFEP